MQDIRRARLLLTLLIVGGTGAWAQISAEEVRLLDPATTPWYVYVATGPQPDAEAALGQLAPANWSAADFDDSHWGRYCGELKQLTGCRRVAAGGFRGGHRLEGRPPRDGDDPEPGRPAVEGALVPSSHAISLV